MLIVCEVYHGRSAKQQLVTVGRQTEWAGTKSKLKVNLSRLVWKSKTKVRNHASLVETGTEAPPLVRSSNHYRSFNEGFVLRSASNGPRACAWLLCSRPSSGLDRSNGVVNARTDSGHVAKSLRTRSRPPHGEKMFHARADEMPDCLQDCLYAIGT